MSFTATVLLCSGIVFLGLIFYLVMATITQPAKSKHSQNSRKEIKVSGWYRILKSLPFFTRVLLTFEALYYDGGAKKEDAKNLATKNVRKMFLISCIIPLGSIAFIPNLLLWVPALMLIPFTFLTFKNKYVSDIYLSDVLKIKKLIEMLTEEFNATDDIRRSYSNIETRYPEYAFLVEKVIDIMDAEDPDEALDDFFMTAPNKFLKQIISLSMDVVTYGDSRDEHEQSRFVKGLSILLEEVDQEVIFTREQIVLLPLSTVWIYTAAIIPYPMILVVSKMSFFDTSVNYLASPWFYVTTPISWAFTALTMLHYITASRVKTEYDIVFSEKKVYKFFFKFKSVRILVNRIAPVHRKTVRSDELVTKTEKILKDASSNLTVQEFFFQKIAIVTVVFVALISLMPFGVNAYKNGVFNPNWETMSVSDSKSGIAKNKARFEYSMYQQLSKKGLPQQDPTGQPILDYEGNPVFTQDHTPEKIKEYLYQEVQYLGFVTDPDSYVEQFLSKLDKHKMSPFPWYLVILAFLISISCWGIPNLLLSMRSKDRAWMIENEIEGYISVLSMITTIKNLKVYDLIDYLYRYAVVFKVQLLTARTYYNSDPEGEIDALESEIRSDQMASLVRKLRQALLETSIYTAFKDLLPSRKFMLESRKYEQIRLLDEKKKYLNGIQMTTVTGAVVLYLFIPFIIVAAPSLAAGLNVFDIFDDMGVQ